MGGNIEKILESIGITLNGNHPWDIQVHNKEFLHRIEQDGSIGAGETYMEGLWDCDQLDELFFRICRHNLIEKFYPPWKIHYTQLMNMLINQQGRGKSKAAIRTYFSLGNHLYELMLGKSMAYTCAYWKDAKTLDEAQFAKYDLICRKLYLKPGDKVLDIGCGWGGLVKFMAENYDVIITAIDANAQSIDYAKQHCQSLPISFYNLDYRSPDFYNPNKIKFDKVVSVGVMEHIGYKNYSKLCRLIRSQMDPQGLFLLHTIGGNVSRNFCDPWIDKYIFPNGHLPSLKQLGSAFENQFVVEDLHNFGPYYDLTLKAWHHNLNAHWNELKNHFNERFRRMMNYYLLSTAGSFRARDMQLWQLVLTPNGILNGYTSIR